jgi:ribosomal protein RSM22 (predicted rRNA methylase)
MSGVIRERSWQGLYPGGVCQPSSLIKSVLDQQVDGLPRKAVSDSETRYPTDESSMRAFLETFFTRHLFQLQKSLVEHVASPDFPKAMQFGTLRILDIGAGPAVASLGMIDMLHRTAASTDCRPCVCPRAVRMVHVLNDTSPICLMTGRHMLTACHEQEKRFSSALIGNRIFTLSTPFPLNMHQIQRMALFLGGYDIIILSYVVNPLVDDCGLRTLATAVRALERLCRPRGRILVVQDKFQESLIQSLAQLLKVEYREQTVTQEVYPPRGGNETYTYTYYDCLYAPREGFINRVRHVA